MDKLNSHTLVSNQCFFFFAPRGYPGSLNNFRCLKDDSVFANLQVHRHAVVIRIGYAHLDGLVLGDLAKVNTIICNGVFPVIVAAVVRGCYKFAFNCSNIHTFQFNGTTNIVAMIW